MSQDVHNVNVSLSNGTLAVGTPTIFGFFAPADGVGGGITITKVDYSSQGTVAAGSAPNYTLVSTDSACLINGTIATAIGSAAFTAGTVRPGTITGAWVDGGYGVAVFAGQTAENADINNFTACIQYRMGR